MFLHGVGLESKRGDIPNQANKEELGGRGQKEKERRKERYGEFERVQAGRGRSLCFELLLRASSPSLSPVCAKQPIPHQPGQRYQLGTLRSMMSTELVLQASQIQPLSKHSLTFHRAIPRREGCVHHQRRPHLVALDQDWRCGFGYGSDCCGRLD